VWCGVLLCRRCTLCFVLVLHCIAHACIALLCTVSHVALGCIVLRVVLCGVVCGTLVWEIEKYKEEEEEDEERTKARTQQVGHWTVGHVDMFRLSCSATDGLSLRWAKQCPNDRTSNVFGPGQQTWSRRSSGSRARHRRLGT
jgi:hypothetical protein